MGLCQRIFWCLAFLIFGQSFKSIGSIEQSSEPQNVPNLCCAQNFIETEEHVSCYLCFSIASLILKCLPSYIFFNKNHNFRVRN